MSSIVVEKYTLKNTASKNTHWNMISIQAQCLLKDAPLTKNFKKNTHWNMISIQTVPSDPIPKPSPSQSWDELKHQVKVMEYAK